MGAESKPTPPPISWEMAVTEVDTMRTFPTLTIWFVDARTGCSCCADENFTAGPFETVLRAESRATLYRANRRLASQFSETGIYTLRDEQAELLPDGRLICGDTVFPGFDGEERRT